METLTEKTRIRISEKILRESIKKALQICFRKDRWSGWYISILVNIDTGTIINSEFHTASIIFHENYIVLTRIEQFYTDYENTKNELENEACYNDYDISCDIDRIYEYIESNMQSSMLGDYELVFCE